MTDEDANSNTALWPSEANIVSLWLSDTAVCCTVIPSHAYRYPNELSWRHCAISSAAHPQGMLSYFSVRLFPCSSSSF